MLPFASVPFPRLLTSAAALLLLALPTLAQQRVCMSLHSGPANGTNSTAGRAQIAARVNGVQVSIPTTAGMTPAAASAAHAAAFTAAGFTVERTSPTDFCVTRGPGDTPITSGLCYGTDDMALDLDSSVTRIPPPPPPPPAPAPDPAPETKQDGAVVPLPPAQAPPPQFTGRVVICFWVRVGGIRIRICVTILLQAGLPVPALRDSMQQQLRQHGLLPNRITMADPLRPGQWVEVLQIDRTTNGDLVDGVELQFDQNARHILPNLTGAGVLPRFGSCEYGAATQGAAPLLPWSHAGDDPPRISSFFDVFHELGQPLAPGGRLLGLVPGSAPLLNGQMLVDPAGAVFEFDLTDAAGTLQRRFVVPNMPSLLGLPIHSQGVALAGNTLTLSTGIRAVVGP